ncbi:Dph6-related ATP pyrophosphatase [Halobacterium litoreum]|uniref:ATP-binding protein n=1 Tax=Halobacterium litoreum TaxID=2039234 RepID=A0ABD5NEB4_9EURY|nr:ATP-binding protein [Halobacterium litoreum]UHH13515.1 ATP-binding protein [Halobacterium litoreum]
MIAVSWSGGKDCAVALRELRADPDREVAELLTTVREDVQRSSMHGVRREHHEAQADALGLALRVVELPADVGNDAYERRMREAHEAMASEGIDTVAFADLFLEDIRAYREANLDGGALSGAFPLWGRDTEALAREFAADFDAVVVCVDDDALDASFAGRAFDESFLDDLPDGVDPCGEHGEFHTFVRDGPGFDQRVAVEPAERVTKTVGGGTFHYCELE